MTNVTTGFERSADTLEQVSTCTTMVITVVTKKCEYISFLNTKTYRNKWRRGWRLWSR